MLLLLIAALLVLGGGYLVFAYRRKKQYLETPLKLHVTHRTPAGARTVILRLASDDGAPLPAWTPGSHLVIEFDAPQGKYRRAYSLIGGDAGYWEIAVACQPQGQVSPLLHAAAPGMPLRAQPPRGRFFALRASASRQVCLIGAGVGVAPLIPMALQALARGDHVRLIHVTRDAASLLKHAQLSQLARQHPETFHYHPVLTRDHAHPGACYGRLTVEMLQTFGLSHYTGEVYLCGGAAFVQAQRAHLQQLGSSGPIIDECFSGNTTYNGHVIVVGTKRFVQGHAGSLLAACEAHGVLPFAECRTGRCLNCRARLQQGEVRYLDGVEPAQSLPSGHILTCCCVPSTDIRLAWPDHPKT